MDPTTEAESQTLRGSGFSPDTERVHLKVNPTTEAESQTSVGQNSRYTAPTVTLNMSARMGRRSWPRELDTVTSGLATA